MGGGYAPARFVRQPPKLIMDKQLPIVYKPTLKPAIYLSSYIMSNYIKVDVGV